MLGDAHGPEWCAKDEQSGKEESNRYASKQVVVRDEGQQHRGDDWTCDTLQVRRQPRQGKRLRVLTLVRQNVGNHRLKGGRERGGRDIENGHQGIDLPGLRHKRQQSGDTGSDQIQTDQKRLSGEIGCERTGKRGDRNVGDHLDRERYAENLSGARAAKTVSEKPERDSRKPGTQQRHHLRRKQAPVSSIAERRERRGNPQSYCFMSV